MQVKTITGLRWNDFHFTTVVPLQWLLDNVISGLVLESAQRDLDEGLSVDPRAAELAPLRAQMQRPFEDVVHEKRVVRGEVVYVRTLRKTAKYRNTLGGLTDYLLNQFALTPEEAFGVLPGFVAVWPEPMTPRPLAKPVEIPGVVSKWEMYDYGNLGRGALADGACRHLAAYNSAASPKVPAAHKDKLLHQLVTVEVFHGIDADRAARMFIDLNFEGTPVPGITKANLDPRNKWVATARRVFDELGIGLATTGRQVTESHRQMKQYLLLTHAEQMVKAVVLGPYKALAGRRDESWDGVDFDRLYTACVEWFGEMFRYFGGGDVLADQSRVIRSIPVRVALASLGSAHYAGQPDGRKNASRTLEEIDWQVSPRWNGIGGKVTEDKKGVYRMSAGSGKETITRAVQAITKPETKAGRAVRGLPEEESS